LYPTGSGWRGTAAQVAAGQPDSRNSGRKPVPRRDTFPSPSALPSRCATPSASGPTRRR